MATSADNTRSPSAAKQYDSEQYYNDPEAATKLIARIKGAYALTQSLAQEFHFINNSMMSLGIPRSRSFESMVAHLNIDLNYLRAELEEMQGGS